MNMNKMVSLFTLVCILAGSTVLNAQQFKRVLLTPVKDERAVNIFVDLKEDIPYDISIVDTKGYTVWTQNCDKSVFARSIMMNELPDGTYILKVESANRFFENTFTVGDEIKEVSASAKLITAPTVSVMGSTVLVDFDDSEKMLDVAVKLYSQTGTEVFANNITTDAKRITRYDLSTLKPGHYDMVFTIDDQKFTRNVRVR